MNIYQQQILDHCEHPRNVGPIEASDFTNHKENTSCGDSVKIYLKVADGKIVAIQHETEGCAIAIAAASLLSQDLVGQTIEQVKNHPASYMTDLLGINLSPARVACAHLALEAVQAAIAS